MMSPSDNPQAAQPFGESPAARPRTSREDAPTGELVAAAVGDRCSNCGAPLASDQRYCVECGQRRGKARFSVPSPAATGSATPRRRRRLPEITSGGTLILGIGVLLLAMGVGFEIGNGTGGKATTVAASAPATPQVITVGGAATAAPTTAPAGTRSKAKAPKAKVKVTKQVQAKATAAASKVLGSSGKNLAPATVNVGGKCTHGAGCSNGKFNGHFFGP